VCTDEFQRFGSILGAAISAQVKAAVETSRCYVLSLRRPCPGRRWGCNWQDV